MKIIKGCEMANEKEKLQFSTRADCVIDAVDDAVVVWHVNTGPDRAMSRMVGAWLLSFGDRSVIDGLVSDRRVLATDEGEKALADLGIAVREFIDPGATVRQVSSEIESLHAVYAAHPNSKALVAPAWPAVPSVDGLLMGAPSPEAPTNRALATARWLESVAQCWDRLERERIARRYMPGGPVRRPTPVETSELRQPSDHRDGRSSA